MNFLVLSSDTLRVEIGTYPGDKIKLTIFYGSELFSFDCDREEARQLIEGIQDAILYNAWQNPDTK